MREKYDYIIECDGAAVGNPGVIGIGGVIYKDEKIEKMFSIKGAVATNNEAEYLAVIQALSTVSELNIENQNILISSDSEVVISQINGEHNIHKEHLKRLYDAVISLKNNSNNTIHFKWIPRHLNKIADALASNGAGMPQAVVRDNEVILWDDSFIDADKEKEHLLPEENIALSKYIAALNTKAEKVNFRDFIGLKTGGCDNYSRLKEENLMEFIIIRYGEGTYNWLAEALTNTPLDYKKNVLRWAARGLNPDLALKKASVDEEMKFNLK